MRFTQIFRLALSLAALCIGGATASSLLAQEEASEDFTMLVGTVTGIPDEFVGLAIVGDTATVYICDGRPADGTVSIAEWFIGTVENNLIDITAISGNRVQITLDGNTAAGQFTFTYGDVKAFELAAAEGNSGLYRSEFALGDLEYVGGWLVLPDGSVRGAVRDMQSGDLVPATLSQFEQIN